MRWSRTPPHPEAANVLMFITLISIPRMPGGAPTFLGGDPNLAFFAERGEEMMAVLVGTKYGLFVVAALGEVKPVAASTGRREAKSGWHFALRR